MTEQKQLRCAIYTRKSSEEGLEQNFNSLQAQREACEAYIRSQSHEGWKLITDHFDDGGFSGGNMNRPSLEELMSFVKAGKVDVIVIYKIDRLTRSLTDFARLAEVLDKHQVSFVSVTQQFNTTTSMGRLMLNVLLSFAQFEREITGERIRDKIAASKKKGMWMGGNPPMGYEAKDRTLVINPADAATVNRIFAAYLEQGTVPKLLDRLAAESLTTGKRITIKGRMSGGRPFTRGHLYKLLSNPIYIGRIPHKTSSHPGLHAAIIDAATWDKVQAQLAVNTQGTRTRRSRAKLDGALLAGLLHTEAGNRMIVSHATKGARRYRYYVEERPISSLDRQIFDPVRLPAGEIEAAALSALHVFLGDQRQVLHHLDDLAPEQKLMAVKRLPHTADVARQGGRKTAELFRSLAVKVVYGRDRLGLYASIPALKGCLGIADITSEWPQNGNQDKESFCITTPLIYRRRGAQAKLVVQGANLSRQPDASLVLLLARARAWAQRMIDCMENMSQIAKAESVSMQYVARVVPLAFLAPELVQQVLDGTQPQHLTANKLAWVKDLHLGWRDQITELNSQP